MNADDERDPAEEQAQRAHQAEERAGELRGGVINTSDADELDRRLLAVQRDLSVALHAIEVLGDACRAVANSRDVNGLQAASICQLAAQHADAVLLELKR